VVATPIPEISDEPLLEVSEPIKKESSSVNESAGVVSDEVSLMENSEVEENEAVFEPVNFEADETEEQMISAFSDENEATNVETSGKIADVPETFVAAETVADADVVYDDFKKSASSSNFLSADNDYADENPDDGGYHITVIKEKGVQQRNMLLLGAAALMITLTLAGVVYSIFEKNLLVGAINDDGTLVATLNVNEVPIDVEKPKKKDDDKGGGGGGGGKEEKNETSKGVLADQTEKPEFPPTSRAVKLTSPSLMIKRSTQGPPRKQPPTDEPYGNPNSTSTLTSDGKGSGGGMGSGRGTGQGSGIGTGEGSGIGSGSGNGRGNGIGDGRGDGTGDRNNRPTSPPPPRQPPPPAGPTTEIQILSKPRPGYTDSARTNNVQGTVMLTVTFLANGSIGGVSAVKGLPEGLTDKAIAAARQIQFKPAMKNGQAYTVVKRIQYNFTIY
jgi:TonB family protein